MNISAHLCRWYDEDGCAVGATTTGRRNWRYKQNTSTWRTSNMLLRCTADLQTKQQKEELQTCDLPRTFPVLDLRRLLRRIYYATSSSQSIGPCIVLYFYSKTNKIHKCIKFILFWGNTPQVSDGLSVHHQQFKTVRTATGICQTDTAVCLLAGTR